MANNKKNKRKMPVLPGPKSREQLEQFIAMSRRSRGGRIHHKRGMSSAFKQDGTRSQTRQRSISEW